MKSNSLIYQTLTLVKKEIQVEWRNKYALYSIILMLVTSVFIVFTIQGSTDNTSWHSLFYILLVFGVVQNIGRSFLSENPGTLLYMKFMAHNKSVISSKLIYQFLLNSVFLFVLFILMNFFLDQDIQHLWEYIVTTVLFTLCNSAIFTFNAAIALGAKNSSLVASVLSFPLLIPNLIVSLKISSKCLLTIENVNFAQDWLIMLLLTGMTCILAVVLFRNIWTE
ncbi:ABC transporter permease [bacterium]|nr:ABC transporter permease [bacterium]